jgi:acylphosphatase
MHRHLFRRLGWLPAALLVLQIGCARSESPKGSPAVTVKPSVVRAPAAPGPVRRVHVFVSGKVQRVGFRAFTEENARQLGLTGTVRNLDDGRVEAVIEGPAEKTELLLERLKSGPPRARVTLIELTEEKPTGEFEDFRALW